MLMGWDFRGLYCQGTGANRARLAADPLIRGRFAHIAAGESPEHRLPPGGLLVVHGFGPRAGDVPWELFGAGRAPAWTGDLPAEHRPPGGLLAWMRGFGAPVVLYQCQMSAGTVERESSILSGHRAVLRGRDPVNPLLALLLALGATPDPQRFSWYFKPHEQHLAEPLLQPGE
ncbi:hypothetical protein ACQP1P_25130 [Dactylosporangium sp. CA-052675]|uniref:hypothetical protein n=1 Tax=Dactylosporangium sp. CA-052675 TaxID=3239927 RepID=UPI003D8BF593